MRLRRDLAGQAFGRLTALCVAGKNKHGDTLWECSCECGGRRVVIGGLLTRGETRSCGCLAGDVRRANAAANIRELQDLGWGMHLVPLGKDERRFALISSCDATLVGAHNWFAARNGHVWYAVRHEVQDGVRRQISMHRTVLGLGDGESDQRLVDHVNGDGLDNTRDNIRIATKNENCRNTRRYSNNTSGAKGVFFRKESGRWRAIIGVDGRLLHLGTFATREEAAAAYRDAAVKHFGEFARIA